ncbi:MAG TPA: hypothetical protein VL092_02400 [Chitinophagaceae bacterium]|nr:hypothetical protein [Chitinophagaceae bacterium]
MKTITSLLFILLLGTQGNAQLISSKRKNDATNTTSLPIHQNEYISDFVEITEMELLKKDSIHYRIKLYDDMLKELGHIDFNDKYLTPYAAASGGGLLCIAYLRTEQRGTKAGAGIFFSKLPKPEGEIYLQFIDSSGKIVQEYTEAVKTSDSFGYWILRNPVVLSYVAGQGFVFAYGDGQPGAGMYSHRGFYKKTGIGNKMTFLNEKGEKKWQLEFSECYPDNLRLLTTGQYLYLLRGVNKNMIPAVHEMLIINSASGKLESQQLIYPHKEEQLNCLEFRLDSRKEPVLSGIVTSGTHTSWAMSKVLNPLKYSFEQKILFKMLLSKHYEALVNIRWKDTQALQTLIRLQDTTALTREAGVDATDKQAIVCEAYTDSLGDTYFWGPVYEHVKSKGNVSCRYVQLRLSPEKRLTLDHLYPADTVKAPAGITYLVWVPRLFNSYFKIAERPYVAIGDEKALRVFNFRTGETVREVKRREDGLITRRFLCTRPGHVSTVEWDFSGNRNVFVEPVD